MRAPRLPSIFKYTSAKQFTMSTRYYDERKERISLAKEKYKLIDKSIHKGYFLNAWEPKNQGYEKVSSIRLLLLIIALSTLTYYILKY
jgi:hypothetical protein